MILIYTATSTTRLQYICRFIFKEQLGIAYSLTIDADGFRNHEGPKINYSSDQFDSSFNIQNHSLLFEDGIRQQDNSCFETDGYKAFFKTKSGDIAFDLFAACFYLLSRYEEYLPHEKDSYGRYAHENSLAFKEGFLNIPLINIWLSNFLKKLQFTFPGLAFQRPAFRFIPTYDIDIAWSYKNKGILRTIGGFIKQPSLKRLKVLSGLERDPFNSYDFLHSLHRDNNLHPVYFFLVSTSRSLYDKNISPFSNSMWQLIRQHAKKYIVGLHPSWKSNEKPSLLIKEKKILETAAQTTVINSRQHYIKFNLPDTLEKLSEAGIENEYSMGYGSINGFRASVASPFNWYNLKKEEISPLRIYPFCFMDANSFYEQKLNSSDAYDELMHYYRQCKNHNGTLITIFHNNILGTDKAFEGWKEMYSRFISQLPR